jgi:hypothetical protein
VRPREELRASLFEVRDVASLAMTRTPLESLRDFVAHAPHASVKAILADLQSHYAARLRAERRAKKLQRKKTL